MSDYYALAEAMDGNMDTDNDNVCCVCPSCGKQKLYLNIDNGLFICFSCEMAGDAVRLVALLEGVSILTARTLVRKYRASTVIESSKELKEKLRNIKKVREVRTGLKLPSGHVPIAGTKGERYLLRRGFSKKLMQHFDLRFMRDGDWFTKNHILFPCRTPKGVLNFWTTRAAWDPVERGPKSQCPAGASRKDVLYGMDKLALDKEDRRGIIVEGPLDTVSLRGTGIGLLGKYMSMYQADAINDVFKRHGVIISLDSEERRTSWEIAHNISSMYAMPLYVSHTGKYKDPAEALKDGEDPVEIIRANAVPYSMKNYLKAKATL